MGDGYGKFSEPSAKITVDLEALDFAFLNSQLRWIGKDEFKHVGPATLDWLGDIYPQEDSVIELNVGDKLPIGISVFIPEYTRDTLEEVKFVKNRISAQIWSDISGEWRVESNMMLERRQFNHWQKNWRNDTPR